MGVDESRQLANPQKSEWTQTIQQREPAAHPVDRGNLRPEE
jgi:hypothetical protein